MRRRDVYLRVRLTAEESQRLAQAAQQLGYKKSTDFVRASLGRQGQLIQEVRRLEGRQASTMTDIRTEIARLQRTEYVIFAMIENLAKTILTYMPPPPQDFKAAAIAHGKASYEQYLRAVGMSLHNGSKAAVEKLAEG